MNSPELHPEEYVKALLVVCQSQENSAEELVTEIDELKALCRTYGLSVEEVCTQKRSRIDVKTFVGQGKIHEIAEAVKHHDAKIAVFNAELSGSQTKALEKELGCSVLDRSMLILEIFSENARTTKAKTQIEIARLEYLLPRLTGAWTHFGRQTGGRVRSRGMGEKQIEVDRRRALSRITGLKKRLKHLEVGHEQRAKSRNKEYSIALVGYTNSGKTTLMHELSHLTQQGEDQLFATLDTKIKKLNPQTKPTILISDTVGFIRDLPKNLFDSFKSTLDHIISSDLLIHVVSASDPNYEKQYSATQKVLGEIGADSIPQLLVFNKCDAAPPHFERVFSKKFPQALFISAFNKEDVKEIKDEVFRFFAKRMQRIDITLSQNNSETISLIHRECLILDEEYLESGDVRFLVQGRRSTVSKLLAYQTEGSEIHGNN